MGMQDRDWYRSGDSPTSTGGGGGGGAFELSRGLSVNTWLIILSVAFYFLSVMRLGDGVNPLLRWGIFTVDSAVFHGQVWRFITFQFLHDPNGISHLVFNMIGLFFFGPRIETYLGSRRYLAFYLLCGVAGPLAMLGFWSVGVLGITAQTGLVGASAGIFGVLIAAARVSPNTRVMLLFPPIPMKLRTLAWVVVGIAAYMVLTNGRNAGGEAAHLGGAALGFLLISKPSVLDWADGFSLRRLGGGSRGAGERRIEKPREQRKKTGGWFESDEKREATIDRILDKVNAKGLHSLTDRERRILQEDTERRRRG